MSLPEISAVLLTISKRCTVGMHSGIYEQIRFKLGVMMDNAEYYILLLV